MKRPTSFAHRGGFATEYTKGKEKGRVIFSRKEHKGRKERGGVSSIFVLFAAKNKAQTAAL